MLLKRNSKPVALINKQEKNINTPERLCEKSSDLADFSPFVMDGVVSLPGDNVRVPIKILCDSAASQSFILCDVLAFCKDSSVGSDVPVLGFAMEDTVLGCHYTECLLNLIWYQVKWKSE